MAQKESLRARYTRRLEALRNERSTWIEHWRELTDYILPRRGRFFSSTADRNKGSKRNDKIINNTATIAVRTLASGMMAGITSPARPWFRLSTVDPALAESQDVRGWLHVVEEKIRDVFAKSNIYNAFPLIYTDLGVFGTAVGIVDEDDEDVIRTTVIPPGQYVLATDARGKITTLGREFGMTVEQVVQKFGIENCSQRVKESHEQGRLDEWVDVVHFIAPNTERIPGRADHKGKAFKSCWFEKNRGDNPDVMLSEKGYDENPILAPRWNVTAEDVYGYGPGMDSLGDIKALYILEKRGAQLVDKLTNPPMKGPSSLKSQRVSLLPGDITYVDASAAHATLEPAMVVNPAAMNPMQLFIERHESRINDTFLVKLWLMLSDSDRRQITAREVDERHEEKMLQLGPVLERLHDEMLSPLIDRTFGILLRRGAIPRPPQALQGIDLKVDYISVAAQAQKLLGTTAIERLTSFVGNIAASDPTILDKLNTDEVVDEYANLLGVKPDLVRSDDEVAKIRQARQQAQQQQAITQQLSTVAQGAKTLSETDTGGNNALTQLMGNLGGIPGATGGASA